MSFEQAFPDLAKIAKKLSNLSWGDLELVLEDQSTKRSENITMLGVSIPSALIFSVGFFAVFAMQLYMLLYMARFCSIAAEHPQAFQMQCFPWIGMFPGPLSRIITIFTTTAFPLSAVVLGALFELDHGGTIWSKAVVMAAGLATLASSVALARRIYLMKRLPWS